MRVKTFAELPEKHFCRKCGTEKPLLEMIVIHERKTGGYLLRSCCKDCNNKKERGHRREYKTAYLRNWRKRNADINESYWRTAASLNREKINSNAYSRFQKKHHAILIQGRLRRHGTKVGIGEAQRLLKEFGPCFPNRPGLTVAGLKECERLRSMYRRTKKPHSMFDIRVMVYEDGHYIKPSRQRIPYQTASRNLCRYQKEKKKAA